MTASARSVGRTRERTLLTRAASTRQAALVAVYGRRRVGKTHLVRAQLRPLAGTYFEVAGQSAFDVRATHPTAYLCEYL